MASTVKANPPVGSGFAVTKRMTHITPRDYEDGPDSAGAISRPGALDKDVLEPVGCGLYAVAAREEV